MEVQQLCEAQVDQQQLQEIQDKIGVPHSEETLASLVRVCIHGGNKDLAQHLEGVTMRTNIVMELIQVLRASGYPGYEKEGINSSKNVEERMGRRYVDKYAHHGMPVSFLMLCCK